MILKERNAAEHPESDKWSVAGATAEEKMAFYLRRVFLNDKDIYVFNDLRMKDDTNDSAQIDHLILHRHGFIIIESKSVSSKVKINEHNEWERLWNNHWEGMPSPIQQAKLQGEFLRRALGANAESLITKKILDRELPRFIKCPFDVLVAISDHGSIKREIDPPEVVKADQIQEKIIAIITRHRKAASFFPTSIEHFKPTNTDGLYSFTDDEMEKISRFLIDHHYPLFSETKRPEPRTSKVAEAKPEWKPKPATPASTPPPQPSSQPPPLPASSAGGLGICNKCGEQCIIKWGRDYYWKCTACGNNMPLKEYCPTCKKKLFLRKQKNLYHIYCETCGGERPYCKFVTE